MCYNSRNLFDSPRVPQPDTPRFRRRRFSRDLNGMGPAAAAAGAAAYCRRCGRSLRRRMPEGVPMEEPVVGPVIEPEEEPVTAAEALYDPQAGLRQVDICRDPYRGSGRYPASRRDPYWPSFAHPRWLSCDELYGGR